MRFVIVEDNPADVLLIKEALRQAGIQADIRDFADGAGALKAIRTRHETWGPPPPNLVLLDLNMPRVSGFEVLRELRSTPDLQDVPVAVVTSSSSPRDMEQASRLGASRYIKKPLDLHEFFTTIGSAVRELLATAA